MYVCIRMYVCMYVCMHACMHVCMHACMHAYMHTYIYTCMYACIHTCMHIYIHAGLPWTYKRYVMLIVGIELENCLIKIYTTHKNLNIGLYFPIKQSDGDMHTLICFITYRPKLYLKGAGFSIESWLKHIIYYKYTTLCPNQFFEENVGLIGLQFKQKMSSIFCSNDYNYF